MLALPIAKKIEARYGISLKITARASQRMDWKKAQVPETGEAPQDSTKKTPAANNSPLDGLIADLEKLTF